MNGARTTVIHAYDLYIIVEDGNEVHRTLEGAVYET